MIQSLNAIRRRIKSIQNTRKITRAMQMVSAAKLSRTRTRLFRSRPYYFKLESILQNMLENVEGLAHPLLEKRSDTGKIALCVMTSDAGLCSTYNSAIIHASDEFTRSLGKDRVKLITVGKEALQYFRRDGFDIVRSYIELHGRYSSETSFKVAGDLIDLFLQKQVDEVYVAHTHFNSMLRYKPTIQKYLNIEYEKKARTEYIIEPGTREVADEIIPRYIYEKFRLILLDAFTSEHAARMVAMKTATDNAEEIMNTLTLLRNKARQAAITKEVIEIASAAEALRG